MPARPKGLYPMLYGFFAADGRLRLDAFGPQVDAAVACGAAGIAVLGLGTEVQKLTQRERRETVEAVAGRNSGRLPLCVTVAGDAPSDQVGFARFARNAGADWVMLQPPRQSVAEEDLIAFFGAVADALDCPVGIQNAPEFLGYGLTYDGLIELARRHGNVQVVKAETSAVGVERLIDGAAGSLAVFNGRCGLELVDNLRAGVAGMIPGIETIDVQAAIWNASKAGDVDLAERLYGRLCPAIAFIMQGIPHFITYGKRIAARRLGMDPGEAREPALAPTRFGIMSAERFADGMGPLPT